MSLKPFYERNGIVVLHGDCRDILPQLEAVDHVITDPPYAPRSMKNMTTASMVQRRDGVIFDFQYAALTDEVRTFAAAESGRLAKRWVLSWCDIESAHLWRCDLESAGLRYIRTGIWVREHGAPQFSGDRPGQGVEACVIAHSAGQRLAWNGGGRPAAWVGPIVNASDASRKHTSPKPLWLMKQLIADFTDPGDTVLDMFAGSLTTMVACAALGRKGIAVELNEQFIVDSLPRLEAAVLQQPLYEKEEATRVRLAL